MNPTQQPINPPSPNFFVLTIQLIYVILKELSIPLFQALSLLLLLIAPYIIVASIISILLLAIIAILRVIFFIQQQKKHSVFLEITPSHTTLESQFSTEQLFTTMHSIFEHSSRIDKIIGNKRPYSFELVSSKEQGIRYIIKTSRYNATLIKKNVRAYLPSVEVNTIEDYIPKSKNNIQGVWQIIEMQLARHFAIPLMTNSKLTAYDPIAYITLS